MRLEFALELVLSVVDPAVGILRVYGENKRRLPPLELLLLLLLFVLPLFEFAV